MLSLFYVSQNCRVLVLTIFTTNLTPIYSVKLLKFEINAWIDAQIQSNT